jgi:hypothetical protein
LRTITDKDNTDEAFSDPLPASARYVAFVYSSKVSGNLQLDKLSITAGAPSAYESWAAGYGLASADAGPQVDFDHDGYVNLAEYGLGHSPVVSDHPGLRPLVQLTGGKLQLTAIVRTTDSDLAVSAQRTTDITNPNSWTGAGITQVVPVDQNGVPAGFTRVIFEVEQGGGGTTLLRLKFALE